MRSKHSFAQMQNRILHSIHTSQEFKQKRQHPMQIPQIEVAVALHFIHFLETADSSRFIVSDLGAASFGAAASFGSSFISKSIFTKECSEVEVFLSAIIYILLYKFIFSYCPNSLFQTIEYMRTKLLILGII
jgi:hypothetical protein